MDTKHSRDSFASVLCVMALVLGIGGGLKNHARAGEIVADFRDEFTSPTPPADWRYQRNDGSIFDTNTYVDLVWDNGNNWYDQSDNNGFDGPMIRSAGGHPEGGPQYAIAGYRVAAGEAGYLALTNSFVNHGGAGGNGVDVYVFVNDRWYERVPQVFGESHNLYTALGYVNAGDWVFTCVGPGPFGVSSGNDSFGMEMNIAKLDFKALQAIASYRADYPADGVPVGTWTYQYATDADIGNSAQYQDLEWDGTRFDRNGGDSGWNTPGLSPTGGHPDSPAASPWAIAGITVPAAGAYLLTDTSLARPNTGGTTGIDIRLYVNDALVREVKVPIGTTKAAFDTLLGELQSGDRVYVALGPDGQPNADSTQFDFTLARIDTDPRGTLIIVR